MKKENGSDRESRKMPNFIKWLMYFFCAITIAAILIVIFTPSAFKFSPSASGNRTESVKYYDFEEDDRFDKTETECFGIKCESFRNRHEKTETEEYMKYLKFSSREKAEKAFEMLKENGYENIEEEGDTYFIGWAKDVTDAAIKEMVCLYDNLIVSTEIYISSEMPRSEDDNTPAAFAYPERKEFIIDNFFPKE